MAKKMELLKLETVHLLDNGELSRDFNEILTALAKDCLSRPTIKKARKLSLHLELSPRPRNDGTCDDVVVEASTSAKAPSRPVSAYLMRATVNGGLKYQPESPFNPDAGQEDES